MQVFVVGPPRSGTTIVSQVLNAHPRVKIFDEVDFIDIAEFGEAVVGKLRAFLMERGLYDAYRTHAEASGNCAAAMDAVLASVTTPEVIWGEKNPMYATRLDVLRRAFPDALILYVLRDPRQVVNSYLTHRASPSRSPVDFWIRDTVTDALSLVESCLQPLRAPDAAVSVVRYESFVADAKGVLEAALSRCGLAFPQADPGAQVQAPETVGQHQFFRRNAVLPWKSGNLTPLQRTPRAQERLDPADPAWARVDALAAAFGYA